VVLESAGARVPPMPTRNKPRGGDQAVEPEAPIGLADLPAEVAATAVEAELAQPQR
jgi:hypothetical protein